MVTYELHVAHLSCDRSTGLLVFIVLGVAQLWAKNGFIGNNPKRSNNMQPNKNQKKIKAAWGSERSRRSLTKMDC